MTSQIIQIRDTMENTANNLNQIASTMELILMALYEPDGDDPCREAFSLLWRNLLTARDNAYSVCIDIDRANKVREVTAW